MSRLRKSGHVALECIGAHVEGQAERIPEIIRADRAAVVRSIAWMLIAGAEPFRDQDRVPRIEGLVQLWWASDLIGFAERLEKGDPR